MTNFFQKHVNNIIGISVQAVAFLLFVAVVQQRDFEVTEKENAELRQELVSMQVLVENDPAPFWLKEVIEASGDSDIEFKMSYINPVYEDIFHITNEFYKDKTDFQVWNERAATNYYLNDLQTYTSKKNGCYKEYIPDFVGSTEARDMIVCKWMVNKANGVSYIAGRVVEFNKTKEID